MIVFIENNKNLENKNLNILLKWNQLNIIQNMNLNKNQNKIRYLKIMKLKIY